MRTAIYARVSTTDQKCECSLQNSANTFPGEVGNRQRNMWMRVGAERKPAGRNLTAL